MPGSPALLSAPARILPVAVALLVAFVVVPSPASAEVRVSRAELADGRLRVEGSATVNRTITVDGVAMATSDSSGTFRVSRSGYTPPADCTVAVDDESARPVTVALSGCTATAPPPAVVLPDRAELGPFAVGVPVPTTVVTLANAVGPTQWSVAAGALPDGLSLVVPEPAGRPSPPEDQTSAEIRGTPTTEQTSTVTLRATDANGLTASRTYTIRVDPPPAMAITPQAWPPLRVGESANLWFDGSGGLPPYSWALVGGSPPPGMTLIDDTADDGLVRVGGTPTASGTSTWTLRLTDTRLTSVERTSTVTVDAASAIAALTISPAAVSGGASATGTVTLDAPAPAAGAEVALASSDPSVAAVNVRVFVPAASTTGTFPISTAAVTASRTVTVTATHAGSTRTATLTVDPAGTAPPELTAPSLLSPAEGARWAPGATRTFDWTDVAGAASYTVQVSATSTFTAVQVERVVPASQVALAFSSEGTRYWRVRAADSSGGAGPWSAVRSFRVKN